MRRLLLLIHGLLLIVGLSGCAIVDRLTGPDPADYYDQPGQVEMIKAAKHSDVEKIREIAASGVDINGVSNTHDRRRSKLPMLFFVVEFASPSAVTAMLRAGADPLAPSAGNYSAGGYAILRDKVDSLRAILDFDERLVESPDRLGGNILHTAVLYRNRPAIELLLARHVNLETRQTVSGETPLFGAATQRDIGVCLTLLKAGANGAARDNRGHTFSYPLYMANEKVLSGQFKRDRANLENELRRRGFPVEPH